MSASFTPYRRVTALSGHEGAVSAIKFSPDGRWLATASADKTVRLWRCADLGLERVLSGHGAGVSDLSWSPASDYLASASDDKTVGLWRVQDGRLLRACKGHTAFVFCCAFSPANPNLLASGSFDETVRLWEARSGRCIAVLPAHSDPVTSVAFCHDGSLLVSASYDGLTRLWNPLNGACMKTLVCENNPPFSPNGLFLLLGTLDSTLRLWEYAEGGGECVRTYRGHAARSYCSAAAFGLHDGTLLAGGEDGRVTLWDLQSGEVLQTLGGGAGRGGEKEVVVPLDVHPARRLLACGALEGEATVVIWTAEDEAMAE